MENKIKELTKAELEKLLSGISKNHTKLIKWLYDNHKDILREYEDKECGGLRVEFLNENKNLGI